MIYTACLQWLFEKMHGSALDAGGATDPAGLVIIADGVGGFQLCGLGLTHAVTRARLPFEVRVWPWGHGLWRWYADLSDVPHRREQAARIAEEVLTFRDDQPGRPVFLVGKSGGGGVVVEALERLGDDMVEVAVLLAPALSANYNLSDALRAIKKRLVVFWSPLDVIVLGLGTMVFGTVDRVRAPAAGLLKFREPRDLDEASRVSYRKLVQVRWAPAMARTGYLGGHVGVDSPAFLREYVLPLFNSPTSSPHFFSPDHPEDRLAREGMGAG